MPVISDISKAYGATWFNYRGTGFSGAGVDSPGESALVEDLAAVINASGIRKPVLIGVSDGVAAAVQFAAQNSDAISALVCLSGFVKGPLQSRNNQCREEWAAIANLIQSRDQICQRGAVEFLRSLVTDDDVPTWKSSPSLPRNLPLGASRLFEHSLKVDLQLDYSRLTVPTLYIAASRDPVFPAEGVSPRLTGNDRSVFFQYDQPRHLIDSNNKDRGHILRLVCDFMESEARNNIGAGLSGVQRKLLRFLKAGASNAEIAEATCLSEKTVRNYVSSTLRNLGYDNRLSLAMQSNLDRSPQDDLLTSVDDRN